MIQCWGCNRPKEAGLYLCAGCWRGLPTVARASLNKRDTQAGLRLLELRRQLANGVRLSDVRVTP